MDEDSPVQHNHTQPAGSPHFHMQAARHIGVEVRYKDSVHWDHKDFVAEYCRDSQGCHILNRGLALLLAEAYYPAAPVPAVLDPDPWKFSFA
jgi:hypothetical protein